MVVIVVWLMVEDVSMSHVLRYVPFIVRSLSTSSVDLLWCKVDNSRVA